ncbi:hypothetical protein QR680_012627 [Steinernema hermaphroditum]|uniref:Activin types I and II receptor domain-containing protein n=1 Tax=Steinernema hermaphroditum TaxID=289476 RepID=A0AA39I5E1_9BILA|nr:hypothetical protein QR680_012627 [Steinernema hermaphroditum]
MNLLTTVALLAVLVAPLQALRCKCTQSSAKTPCDAGVCSVPDGESGCLSLDHPTSGLYYACSKSRLPHNHCNEKLTKSGITVRVCSCDDADFCNARLWPTDDAPAARVEPRRVEITAEMSAGIGLPLLGLSVLLPLLLLHCS